MTIILSKIVYCCIGIMIGIAIGSKNKKKEILVPKNIKELQELSNVFEYSIDENYILEIKWEVFDFINQIQARPMEVIYESRWEHLKIDDYVYSGNWNKLDYKHLSLDLTPLEREILSQHFFAYLETRDKYLQSLKEVLDKNIIKEKIKINSYV